MMISINDSIKKLHGPIIITGASGFIGANLFNLIYAVRKDVYAIIFDDPGWRLEGVSLDNIQKLDLNDEQSTGLFMDKIKPKTIFDCKAYGAYSFELNISKIYQTNFLSTISLINKLKQLDIKAFIHAGSSSEYGFNCQAPQESDVCLPNSDYAVSKLSVANYLKYVGQVNKFPCLNLRLYSVYGPLEDTSRLIPTAILAGIDGKYPPFVSEKISRDFVYVVDVCEAFIMAALNINPEIYGESFNIGTGVRTSIKEFANQLTHLFSIKESPKFSEMENRSWDLEQWYSNPEKANLVLNWTAKTSLKAGLIKTSEWIQGLSKEKFYTSSKRISKERKRSISAIIACYKDAQAIPVMHKRLEELFNKINVDYEIIFVNDCSPDDSAEIIADLSSGDPHVLGINHSRNFGSQMAFRSGMEMARMDAVVLLDGDLQDPPELIASFYEKWCQGYDVVYGRRVKREMNGAWELLYKIFYRIFSTFSYISIPNDAGDFSLIDRKVVQWILRCRENDLFLRGLRAYVGFKQTGVDYIRPERMFGHSTNNLFKNIEWAKKGIFSFSSTPLTMLTTVGFILCCISIFLAILEILLKLLFPDIAPKGITTVVVAVLVIGSINLFAIGVVGEYIAKIFLEVKARPHFIRTSLIKNGQTIPFSQEINSH